MALQTGIEPTFVLYFDCPEEEMERRLLSRNQVRQHTMYIKKYVSISLCFSVPDT
jgi:thymidylate kinase